MHVASLLRAVASAGVVDQNVAHDLRGESEEVRPVLPARVRLISQAKVSLVDQSRSLQCVARIFALHVALSHTVQLCIDQRHQLLERALIAFAPSYQPLGYLLGRRCHAELNQVTFRDSYAQPEGFPCQVLHDSVPSVLLWRAEPEMPSILPRVWAGLPISRLSSSAPVDQVALQVTVKAFHSPTAPNSSKNSSRAMIVLERQNRLSGEGTNWSFLQC